MVRKVITVVLLTLAVVLLSSPAGASLVPMSWGFPTLVQDHTLLATQNDIAQSTDTEAASVAFPTSTMGACSTFGTSFPTITQTSAKNDFLLSTKFMQENEHLAFAYPYVSIGGAPVPSMGFL